MTLTIKADLRQKHLVGLLREMRNLRPKEWADDEDMPAYLYQDLLVRAAAASGWFEEPVPDIDELPVPNNIPEVATEVFNLYKEALNPDPNSS